MSKIYTEKELAYEKIRLLEELIKFDSEKHSKTRRTFGYVYKSSIEEMIEKLTADFIAKEENPIAQVSFNNDLVSGKYETIKALQKLILMNEYRQMQMFNLTRCLHDKEFAKGYIYVGQQYSDEANNSFLAQATLKEIEGFNSRLTEIKKFQKDCQ